MKKSVAFCALLCLVSLCVAKTSIAKDGTKAFSFPEVDGLSKNGKPLHFEPSTLYEYVNGAAETYLDYGFDMLDVQMYQNGKGQSIDVEVYRMDGEHNGFGIYSKERIASGKVVPIGADGYVEKGVLNFLKGQTYVKIIGHRFPEGKENILTTVATHIARVLKGSTALPKILSCFPNKDRVKNSQRFIAKNFLGYGFLRSAFVAEYVLGDRRGRAFIIETDEPSKAKQMLDSYFDMAKKKGNEPIIDKGLIRVLDPYHGQMCLRLRDRFFLGVLEANMPWSADLLDQMGQCLEKYR